MAARLFSRLLQCLMAASAHTQPVLWIEVQFRVRDELLDVMAVSCHSDLATL